MGKVKEMSEDFLHYIWKFQLFDFKNLRSIDGSEIMIKDVGVHNANSGPDFLNAVIRIGNLDWWGSVEIHIFESDWKNHKHHLDPAYNSVVLHVVWKSQCNQPYLRSDKTLIPTLQLESRVSLIEEMKHYQSVKGDGQIACSYALNSISKHTVDKMLVHSLTQRMERRIKEIWRKDSDFKQMVLRRMFVVVGMPCNTQNFEDLFEVYKKAPQCELLGVSEIAELLRYLAGFDSYQSKQRLPKGLYTMPKSQWKSKGVRPASLPYNRMDQLALILFKKDELIELIKSASSANELLTKCNLIFNKQEGIKPFGAQFTTKIIINAIAPLILIAEKKGFRRKTGGLVLELLKTLPAEQNANTRFWEQHGLRACNAAESQSLLELKTNYCDRKCCLFCKIGLESLALQNARVGQLSD